MSGLASAEATLCLIQMALHGNPDSAIDLTISCLIFGFYLKLP